MLFVPIMYLVMSTLSPGPVTILTVQNSACYGRRAGTAVALGGVATTAVFLIIALIFQQGSAATISSQHAALYQRLGGVMIFAMGIVAGYKSLRCQPENKSRTAASARTLPSFLMGMGLMLPYFPHAIIFYLVILPNHMGGLSLPVAILLTGAFKMVITFCWYAFLALAAQSIQHFFFEVRVRRVLDFGVACMLIGISFSLLV